MSTASLILFVLSGVSLAWQVVLVILAFTVIHGGRYTRVKIGMLPLIFAAVFGIAGILVR